jgi:hypothetical protein
VEILPSLSVVSRKLINAYNNQPVHEISSENQLQKIKEIDHGKVPIESVTRFRARAVEGSDGITIGGCAMAVVLGCCTISTKTTSGGVK